MRKIIDPFTVNLPTIDVHGETTESVVFILNSFINDNLKMKNYKIVIIHGKGTGILRHKVQELLGKNKKVLSYFIDGSNDGQTIITLKKD